MNAIDDLEETANIFLLLRGASTLPLNAQHIDELQRAFPSGNSPASP